MIHTSMGLRFALALVVATATGPLAAQDPSRAVSPPEASELYTVEELDNLLAPVALYPDPILAQVLVAATFPDQIALAARYVRTYGTGGIDDQAWDVSVKAVAHYPPVLNLLADRPDWTTALGRAYALQSGDVMASVQSLREMARAQGNLVSTAQQRVEVEPQVIRIIPAQPTVIYVPTYDPEIIYYRPVSYVRMHTPYWSFGIAFPIGVWLTYDMDWGHRRVYCHGWNSYGRSSAWYVVSRPFITINHVYVNSYRTTVVINRSVVHRRVRYENFDRYNTVHRRVSWDRRTLPGRGDDDRRWGPSHEERTDTPTRRDDRSWDSERRRAASGRPNDATRRDIPDERPDSPARRETATGRPNDASRRDGYAERPSGAPEERRVTPLRVGGARRPLYSPEASGSPDVERRSAVTRERAPATDNGTWNARPTPSRGGQEAQPRRLASTARGSDNSPDRVRPQQPVREAPRYSPRPEPYGTRQASPRGTFEPREAPRQSPAVGRAMPRAEPRYEPRSQPRAEPRGEPRTGARANAAPSAATAAKPEGRSARQRY